MTSKKISSPIKNVRLIVELSPKIRQELKARAALEGLNMREVVTKLIEDYLKKGNHF